MRKIDTQESTYPTPYYVETQTFDITDILRDNIWERADIWRYSMKYYLVLLGALLWPGVVSADPYAPD